MSIEQSLLDHRPHAGDRASVPGFYAGCVSPVDARHVSPLLARAPKPVPSPANRWPQGSEVVVSGFIPVGEFPPRSGRLSPSLM